MLQAKATSKLMGIEIIGDYLDLRKLYESIQAVTEFKDKYASAKYSTDISDQLRSFNYEIRRAYQGYCESIELESGLGNMRSEIHYDLLRECDDNEIMRKNHESGNLYYKVKIPYIEAIGCMIVLMEILQKIRNADRMKKTESQYCNATWRLHWKTVALFVAVLDDAIEVSIGKSPTSEIGCWNIKNRSERFDIRYIEFLDSFYLTRCVNMNINEKKEMLYVLILLLLRVPKANAVYNLAFSEMLSTIPDYTHFHRYMLIEADASEDGEVYMDEIFGFVDWKGMDW